MVARLTFLSQNQALVFLQVFIGRARKLECLAWLQMTGHSNCVEQRMLRSNILHKATLKHTISL